MCVVRLKVSPRSKIVVRHNILVGHSTIRKTITQTNKIEIHFYCKERHNGMSYGSSKNCITSSQVKSMRSPWRKRSRMKSLSWELVISSVLEGKYAGKFRRIISKKWWAWWIGLDVAFMSLWVLVIALLEWKMVDLAQVEERWLLGENLWIVIQRSQRTWWKLVQKIFRSLSPYERNLRHYWVPPVRESSILVRRDLFEDCPRYLPCFCNIALFLCCHPQFTAQCHLYLF